MCAKKVCITKFIILVEQKIMYDAKLFKLSIFIIDMNLKTHAFFITKVKEGNFL